TTYADAETTQSLNAAYAERVYSSRAAVQGMNVASLVRARLQLSGPRAAPTATVRGEQIELVPEPGISLTARVFMPDSGPARKPAVIYLDASGNAEAVKALTREGNLVLQVGLSGWGQSAPGQSGYTKNYQTAMRAILVGRTIAGMQTTDVLSVFSYLASRSDVQPDHISIEAKGKATVAAMFAAAVEPRIEKVVAENPPVSYLSIVKM